MDLKTAREIIGVPEDCSMEKLTEKYYELTEERLPLDELEKVQNAYNLLRDHIIATTPKPKIPFKEKVQNFFYHYRFHVFGGTILAIIIGLFAYSIISAQFERIKEARLPPPAVEIMIFGDYYEHTDLTPIEEKIYDMFPEWERIKIELIYSPAEMRSELDFAAAQKSAAILATDRPDIYIFDLHHFEGFIEDAPFVPLDPFENETQIEDKWVLFQHEDDTRERIYGIDLTDSDLFTGVEIENDKKIGVIRGESENVKNSMEFLLEAAK